jgi:hypothetical protein
VRICGVIASWFWYGARPCPLSIPEPHDPHPSKRYFGNPPDKPKAREVEFSNKEVLREEVKIYRQTNHGFLRKAESG